MSSLNSCLSRIPFILRAWFAGVFFGAFFFVGHAQAQNVSFPATGVWNGFLGHYNIVECNSLSDAQVTYDLTMLGNDASWLAATSFTLNGGGTAVINLNDLAAVTNQIGTYTISPAAGENLANARLACRTVFYRLGQAWLWKAVEYAFAIPVSDPLTGTVAGVFNSFNPEQAPQPVYNWLTVYNPGSSNFNAAVDIYEGLDGSYSAPKSFRVENLAPGERRDYPLGHEDGYVVGIYRIVPDDGSAPYGAFLTRYSEASPNFFNFAFALQPRQGSCTPGAVTISTFDPATNWVEIANVSLSNVDVEIEGRDQASQLQYYEGRTLAPFAQHHVYVNGFLPDQAVGSVTAACAPGSSSGNLIVQSMFYGHQYSGNTLVEWSYGSQAGGYTPSAGQCAYSSISSWYNAANWNKVVDTSMASSQVTVTAKDMAGGVLAQGSRSLSAGGTADIGIHEMVSGDFLGLAEIRPHSSSQTFVSELIRVYPSSAASIGYILSLPSSYSQCSGSTPPPTPTPTPTPIPTPTPTTPPSSEKAAALADYTNNYLGSDVSDSQLSWNGSTSGCNPGTVSQSAHSRVIQRINYYRRRAGLPDNITLESGRNAKCQQAALIMAANNQLSHSPPASWACYTADGAEAAGKSNLSLGFPSYHSTDAVDGQMEDDGAGNHVVGHRRWILYSRANVMGHGSTNTSQCLWVINQVGSSPGNLPAFIAWPPSGYVPAPHIWARWSFGIPDADFSSATVAMTDMQNNPLSLQVQPLATGYGDNTIVWEPQGVDTTSNSDVTYHVFVQNVIVSGQTRNYSYDVTIIQPGQPRRAVDLDSRQGLVEHGEPPRRLNQ